MAAAIESPDENEGGYDLFERAPIVARIYLHEEEGVGAASLSLRVATEGKAPREVINIMAALKESMQAKGRAKLRNAVRRKIWQVSERGRAKTESVETKAKPAPNSALVVMKKRPQEASPEAVPN